MGNNYWFKMPYFHVYIVYTDKKGKSDNYLEFNWSEEGARKNIAMPYMKNKFFLFGGKRLHPSQIEVIKFYTSEKKFEELLLPSAEPILDASNDYIAMCFSLRKVKGAYVVTHNFIPSPPQDIEPIKTSAKSFGGKQKVFIVHGRDDRPALRLQKYLTKRLKIDADMFEDFKEESSSNTIIEQLEYIRDNVGYAFVIVTPDDLGCLREDIDKCRAKMMVGRENIKVQTVCDILDRFQTRARQNVVFEHGLFIGALGRDKVCCLLQKDTKEKPSDIDGILYVGFKKSVKETFPEITEKLKKAGLIKT